MRTTPEMSKNTSVVVTIQTISEAFLKHFGFIEGFLSITIFSKKTKPGLIFFFGISEPSNLRKMRQIWLKISIVY